MTRNRFTPFLLMAFLLVLPACASKPKAVSDATVPLATQINADMTGYIDQLAPGELQALQRMTNQRYLLACQTGDIVGIVDTWYGDSGEGIRYWYVNYLHGDPIYGEPWGADVLNMKLRNVAVFDYLLTVGDPPEAPPPG